MDKFDLFRSALYQKQTAIITGAIIQDSWLRAEGGIAKLGNPMMGDAFILIGQKTIDGEPYLIAQLSAGKDIGDNGKLYFNREMVNKFLIYGAFCFVDADPDDVKVKQWSCWQLFWQSIKEYMNV